VIGSRTASVPVGFDDFYRVEFERMARLAVVLTGDPAIGEELAQEAFARVQQRFGRVASPSAYTRQVVINLCKRPRVPVTRTGMTGNEGAADPGDQAERVAMLDAVDRLPHRQRAVIVLRYFEDLTEAEIAQVLGCRPGTVKSLSSRALAQLRKDIES